MASKILQYRRISSAAVAAERGGDWKKAAEFWGDASLCASLSVNREWASDRADYCQMAIARGWGAVNVSSQI